MSEPLKPGLVDAWFDAWRQYHVAVNPRVDWEDDEHAPYWANVRKHFKRSGVHDLESAIEASERISVLVLKNKGDHLRKLLAEAKEVYKDRREQFDTAAARSVDQARAESIGCLDCNGQSGIATRFVHADMAGRFVTAQRREIPVGGVVALACCCAVGRWILTAKPEEKPRDKWDKDSIAAAFQPGKSALLDLARYPGLIRRQNGWSDLPDNPACYHPDHWDDLHQSPIAVEIEPGRFLEATRTLAAKILANAEETPQWVEPVGVVTDPYAYSPPF